MSVLLVKLATLGPNRENLIDVEIKVPSSCAQNDFKLMESIIKSPDNLNCELGRDELSPKHYKGDIAIILIINIISDQTIMEQYVCELSGKLCSNLAGEECLLKEWVFVLNTSDSTILNNIKLSFRKIF